MINKLVDLAHMKRFVYLDALTSTTTIRCPRRHTHSTKADGLGRRHTVHGQSASA